MLTDLSESDGSSSLRVTHHISKEVCARQHDTLNEDISCFHVFQHLAPNPADHFPCPLRQIFFFQPVFLARFRQAFEDVMWHFRDSLVHFNCASGPSSFVAVSKLELHVPARQHPRNCCRRVSHVRQLFCRLRAQPPKDRCPPRTSDHGPAPCRRSQSSRNKMGACGAREVGRSKLQFLMEKCRPSMCTCAGTHPSTRAGEGEGGSCVKESATVRACDKGMVSRRYACIPHLIKHAVAHASRRRVGFQVRKSSSDRC